MYEIYMKNSYGPKKNWIIQEKQLIVKTMGKIKLRVINFGYMMAINVTIMYINFQT